MFLSLPNGGHSLRTADRPVHLTGGTAKMNECTQSMAGDAGRCNVFVYLAKEVQESRILTIARRMMSGRLF